MVRVQFHFKPFWQWYCTCHSRLSSSPVSSLKKQRNKLNTNKSKKFAFLSQKIHYNKKTSCSISGGALGVGVVVSADNGNDNVADNNVTEVTNNLDGKNFSQVWKIKFCFLKILCQKKMLNVFLLQLSWSSWRKIFKM